MGLLWEIVQSGFMYGQKRKSDTVIDRVAWITYYWTDSGAIGGERFTSRGKSTRIFIKEDGKWLCIHGHYTAVP